MRPLSAAPPVFPLVSRDAGNGEQHHGAPNRLAIESAQESGLEPEDLPNLNIMGTFDEEPGNRSVYLDAGPGANHPMPIPGP